MVSVAFKAAMVFLYVIENYAAAYTLLWQLVRQGKIMLSRKKGMEDNEYRKTNRI